jgi:hypothetical protein
MHTSPPHASTAKPRLRGGMYLRAEERHSAEVASAELTEILTPAVPDAFITTSAGVESSGAPAASLPEPTRAPDRTPPPIEAGLETEPPWVSEVALPVARQPVPIRPVPIQPIQPVRVQSARAAAGPWRERVPRELVPGAALAIIALASLFGLASSLWPSAGTETDKLATPTAATHAPAAQVPATPTAQVPATSSGNAVVPAARASTAAPLSTQPTGTTGAAATRTGAAATRRAVRPSRSNARAVTPVHTASEGQLRITSTPPGARVTVNGIGWGQTPLTVGHLPLGTKTVRVSREGYASQQRVVELRSSDAAAALNVTLPRASTGRP